MEKGNNQTHVMTKNEQGGQVLVPLGKKYWQHIVDAIPKTVYLREIKTKTLRKEEVDLETLKPGDKRLELDWNSN